MAGQRGRSLPPPPRRPRRHRPGRRIHRFRHRRIRVRHRPVLVRDGQARPGARSSRGPAGTAPEPVRPGTRHADAVVHPDVLPRRRRRPRTRPGAVDGAISQRATRSSPRRAHPPIQAFWRTRSTSGSRETTRPSSSTYEPARRSHRSGVQHAGDVGVLLARRARPGDARLSRPRWRCRAPTPASTNHRWPTRSPRCPRPWTSTPRRS